MFQNIAHLLRRKKLRTFERMGLAEGEGRGVWSTDTSLLQGILVVRGRVSKHILVVRGRVSKHILVVRGRVSKHILVVGGRVSKHILVVGGRVFKHILVVRGRQGIQAYSGC